MKYYCIEKNCNNEIKSSSKRCHSCENKRRHKLNIINNKEKNNHNYKEKIKIKCLQCGETFKVKQSRKNRKFCSQHCHYKYTKENELKKG